MRTLVLVLAAILALGGAAAASEPLRPAGVPAKAFWLGGPDGGVFVVLKRQQGTVSASYSGAVYHPDGSLWYQGKFVLQPANGGSVDPEERGQFAGWDGTQLLLQDGRALIAKGGKQVRKPSATVEKPRW